MSVSQQSFAEAIEHRLQRWWPKAKVTYIGGGWFAFRADRTNTAPATKLRRDRLLSKADAIRNAEVRS